MLHCNNSDNEKGYIRVNLQTINGGKNFFVHRLVLYTFSYIALDYLEVNHIDGNPSNNTIENLEYVTRLENAHHASTHNLYISCDNHHKSRFTNFEVHTICKYLEKGYSISKIIMLMGFENSSDMILYISRIRDRVTWRNISCDYSWDIDMIRYKTYRKCDIELMCQYIFVDNYKISHILTMFPNYDHKNLKMY